MALVDKVVVPSLSTLNPPRNCSLSGKIAGENIDAGDACYLGTDNKIYRSTALAANAAAQVVGYAPTYCPAGQSCTLYWEVNFGYGSGLAIGTFLYLSATNPGKLDTVSSANQTKPVAYVLETSKIRVLRTF